MMYRVWEDRKSDKGFTLTELLVVIAILGILAAVVVFAVGGITDKGQSSACSADKQTIQTAEEAYYAKNNSYTDTAGLVSAKFLKSTPVYYTADTSGNITAVAGKGCS
ncbi:MAG TPA: type II secretion system protein [Acidimicrobiia bacterium]|jgi:general secretion pathway protein G